MKKRPHQLSVSGYLALALLASSPLNVLAASSQPTDISAAPTLASDELTHLQWQSLVPQITQQVSLTNTQQRLSVEGIQGAVGTYTLPADRGPLEIKISSLVENKQVYAPNVLVLDEQQRPAAFYPSSYFRYHPLGVMTPDRLEGTLKLTPALGQRKIYLLIYTTVADLAMRTTLLAPAKAYASGVGNVVPNIPDPVAIHQPTGDLNIQVKTEQNSGNVMIGSLLPSAQPSSSPVVVGAKSAPTPRREAPQSPVLSETENYFNQSIRHAVQKGEIDKALKLMNEAEQLGSKSARKTFISSVQAKK